MASSQKRYFLVSRQLVDDFIGRKRQLDQIRSHFFSDRKAQPRYLILHALGGQGKSQIALEYCRELRETYRGIFWINANSETSTTQSFEVIAAALTGGLSAEIDDSEARIRLVQERLEQWSGAWLLVFDNYDDSESFATIRRFIPTSRNGHVLFTSRNRDLGRLGKLLEIPAMTEDEGVRLVLRGYEEKDVHRQHRIMATRIVERLGGLALAIDQATAYIQYKRMPLDRLEDFLTTYEVERQKILSYTPKNFWEYGTMQIHGEAEQNKAISAFTTWEMSFQQLEAEDEVSKKAIAHFLTLSAFFDPIRIDELMFRYYWEGVGHQGKWMRIFSVTMDEKDEEEEREGEAIEVLSDDGTCIRWNANRFWDVIIKLHELSLLQSISSGTGHEGARFTLHPLVRDWLQLREKTQERRKFTQEAIEAVVCCVKMYGTHLASVEEKTTLTTHMDACLSNDRRFSKPHDRLGRDVANCEAADWCAWFYSSRGRYSASEELYRHIVKTRRSILSERDPSTLMSMNNLALVVRCQGKYEEAEAMQRQELAMCETILGEEHPDTLKSMGNLALTLWDQERLAEAEELVLRIMETSTKMLGPKHPDTLTTMANLAHTWKAQGRDRDAIGLMKQPNNFDERYWALITHIQLAQGKR